MRQVAQLHGQLAIDLEHVDLGTLNGMDVDEPQRSWLALDNGEDRRVGISLDERCWMSGYQGPHARFGHTEQMFQHLQGHSRVLGYYYQHIVAVGPLPGFRLQKFSQFRGTDAGGVVVLRHNYGKMMGINRDRAKNDSNQKKQASRAVHDEPPRSTSFPTLH